MTRVLFVAFVWMLPIIVLWWDVIAAAIRSIK